MQILIKYHLSNRAIFRVYIASSKHEEGWENLTQTRDVVHGLHNFREFYQTLRVFR